MTPGNILHSRFIKFAMVGAFCTVIDFSILNLLSYSTGLHKGIIAAFFGIVSFLAANVGSYALNKNWTFRGRSGNSRYRKFLQVSVFGVLVNALIIYYLTTFFRQNLVSGIVWLNVSKLAATSVVAFINYFGYKKYVFKRTVDLSAWEAE